MVGDNINIMKTTFECNFELYQAFKQHGYTKIWKQKEAVNLKSFTLITCKLVILKIFLIPKTKIKKVVFVILILSPTTVCNMGYGYIELHPNSLIAPELPIKRHATSIICAKMTHNVIVSY